MTLARRLLAGAMVVVATLIAAVVLIAGSRLRDRLVTEKTDELSRDARAIASLWKPGVNADSLAETMGNAFGYRVTIIDSAGVVEGDSEFGPEARRRLENHSTRPEVMECLLDRVRKCVIQLLGIVQPGDLLDALVLKGLQGPPARCILQVW